MGKVPPLSEREGALKKTRGRAKSEKANISKWSYDIKIIY